MKRRENSPGKLEDMIDSVIEKIKYLSGLKNLDRLTHYDMKPLSIAMHGLVFS